MESIRTISANLRRITAIAGVLTLCLFAAGGVFAQVPVADASYVSENYRIGPGDVIDVRISKEELSRSSVRVSRNGTIQLSMFDTDFQAACMTERELADAIKEQYRKYLVNPYVNVSVKEFNSNPVALIGAVNSPGRFQLQRPMRLVELLTFVNGPSQNAGPTIEIIRNTGAPYCEGSRLVIPTESNEELLSLDLDDAFKGGDEANPLVRAGDIIRLTPMEEINAYIQGNVKSSKAISLKEPVTLSQAIAMAGGLAEGAQSDKITIRRQIAGTINRDEIVVSLKDINKQKRDDILLQPNDIVDVPGPTGAKKFFQDMMKGFIPTIARMPVSVIY